MALSVSGIAAADTLWSQTATLSTGAAPVEQTFTPTAAQAGTVDVTVNDVGFPAALTTLYVAVTQGTTVVKSAVVNASHPSPATLSFTATAGTSYVIRLVGVPNAQAGAGNAVVNVTSASTPATVYASFPASFQAAASASQSQPQVVQVTFPAAGSYTATLTDYSLPQPFSLLSALITYSATSTQVLNPGSTTFTVAAPGTYQLTILAAPAATSGLYGLSITGGAPSTTVYPANGASPVTAVGSISGPATVTNSAAGTVTLAATDLAFPNALASVGAVLMTQSGQLIARQCTPSCTASDVASGNAPAQDLVLWWAATAGAGSGSYVIAVTGAGGATLYSNAQSVSSTSTTSPTSAYTFLITVPATGNYAVTLTDFQAPAPLAGLQFGVFQNSMPVQGGSSTSAGSVTVGLQAGTAQVNVVAQSSTGSGANQFGSGIFGISVQTTGQAPSTVFAEAQAVGAVTGSQTLSVTSADAGSYDFTLADGQWPAAFQTLNLFITQGASLIGKVYGGVPSGTVTVPLAVGNYVVFYSAVPDATATAGLYSITVTPTPAPTVTLTVDQPSISAGQSVHLTWSSTNATACAASGSWSGPQPTSGAAVAEGPLNLSSTFTLTCTGPGGTSAPATVNVTVAVPSSGKGGGGSMDLPTLVALAGLVVAARLRRRATSGVHVR